MPALAAGTVRVTGLDDEIQGTNHRAGALPTVVGERRLGQRVDGRDQRHVHIMRIHMRPAAEPCA